MKTINKFRLKSIIFIMLFIGTLSHANIKDKNANDVYIEAEILKNKIVHLAGEKNLKTNYMKLTKQYKKSPRQVLQKTLEVLKKINKYRQNNNLGQVNVPLYPSKDITSEDVYYNVVRLNAEVDILLRHINCKHIEKLSKKQNYTDKTSDDNYYEIWLSSLAMDELLGKGFSPTDNYEVSVLIVDIINFIRNSQGVYDEVEQPKKKVRKHPNHVLYATNQLLHKIAKAEKRLWMAPVKVSKNPQRIITPTEVYDAMQMSITELMRIGRRLGVDRLYKIKDIDGSKTPSDVLQNIEYATKLFPEFQVSKELVQYDKNSLKKHIDDLYALSEFILKKVEYLKEVKGIKVKAKEPPMIYSLNNMHIYQKAIESMEKINKLRIKDKLYNVAVPSSPVKKKTTGAVYELLIMIDDEISIIMEKNGIKNVQRWSYILDKKHYSDKLASDVYHNLWKISSTIDIFRGIQYTPNETFILAKKLEQRINKIVKHLTGKNPTISITQSYDKRPSDVFHLSLELYDILTKIEKRANLSVGNIEIPREKTITPDTVYNSLRVINATLIDLSINFDIQTNVSKIVLSNKKTPSDVYDVINKSYHTLETLLEDSSYEN